MLEVWQDLHEFYYGCVTRRNSFGLQFRFSLLLVSIEMTILISSYRMVVISSAVKSVAQQLLSVLC